ncbi:ABC transporter permease [Streptomyces sp. A012304]|uniref:ABC transporter permease n=1 Tax=Streptomyces sp. A012304 TaxID=375446 RepID=UPI00222F428E|nr:ABC transporter permease [Streptomyces sp. A012304]GKQ37769.1 ABC transporter permease [Streptomyces sp. A012304]
MSFWEYLDDRHQQLLADACRHAGVVLPCVAVATVLGVLVGVVSYRGGRAGDLATAASTVTAVPALAAIGLLVPVAGYGTPVAVIALTLYGLPPIARNAVMGLRGVDPALVDAARGIGMSRSARLLRVELPLAWPPILTGVRAATRTLTGVAALAACVSGPGLGEEILRGLAAPDRPDALDQVLAGTLGIVALGLLFEAGLVLVGRLTVARGIRG